MGTQFELVKVQNDNPVRYEESGHLGIQRTYEIALDRFWWENMFKDVCLHIQSCSTCRKGKNKANNFNSDSQDHIVATERWHTLACDWLYVGHRGRRGGRYVLSVVDLCTRYSIAIPTSDKSGKSLVQALRLLFAFNGYPQRLVSDNESMFRSKEFIEWLSVKGIEKTFTAVYNPRANGLDERFNQTLMNMINSGSALSDWDTHIWDIFYFYNLGTSATTGESPFYLHFLRKGRLPVDLNLQEKLPGEDDFLTLKDLTSKLAKDEYRAMDKILHNITTKHRKIDDEQKKFRKFRQFKIGDKVMLQTPGLGTKQKNTAKTTGPYIIHRPVGRNTYKLKDEKGVKLNYLVNGRRLAFINPRAKNSNKVATEEPEIFIDTPSFLKVGGKQQGQNKKETSPSAPVIETPQKEKTATPPVEVTEDTSKGKAKPKSSKVKQKHGTPPMTPSKTSGSKHAAIPESRNLVDDATKYLSQGRTRASSATTAFTKKSPGVKRRSTRSTRDIKK